MKPKVLLVDDAPSVLSGLRRALYREPFDIVTNVSAIDALRQMRVEPVDVVVSDHDMPEMNGAQFLAEVRVVDPTVVRFMLTGKATLDMAIQAINTGSVDQFFTKPCNHVDLSLAIRRALERKDLMSEARRLLHHYRLQEKELAHLEELHSGILDVEMDEMGAILLEDIPMDYEDLLKEMGAALDSAESEDPRS
ncbi:MAG: DNA-binding NtrC family response regulator [Glaciecola sp.]|jgi:DNA-binding NtrC family response regulator